MLLLINCIVFKLDCTARTDCICWTEHASVSLQTSFAPHIIEPDLNNTKQNRADKMTPLDNPALPKGSTILVTGANGYLGSHVADSALQFGYKVRAAVRNPDKSSWLVEYAEKKYGKGVLDLTKVADMAVEGAYDEAVKGVFLSIREPGLCNLDGLCLHPTQVSPPSSTPRPS